MKEMQVQSLGEDDPLEKEMANHSSILAWEIPMERGAWRAQRIRHDLATKQQQNVSLSPFPVSSFIGLLPVIKPCLWILCCVCWTKSLSCVQLFVTPSTIACQASLSKEFSRQEYWSGLLFPSPGHLPNPGGQTLVSCDSCITGGFFTSESPGKPIYIYRRAQYFKLYYKHLDWDLCFLTGIYLENL